MPVAKNRTCPAQRCTPAAASWLCRCPSSAQNTIARCLSTDEPLLRGLGLAGQRPCARARPADLLARYLALLDDSNPRALPCKQVAWMCTRGPRTFDQNVKGLVSCTRHARVEMPRPLALRSDEPLACCSSCTWLQRRLQALILQGEHRREGQCATGCSRCQFAAPTGSGLAHYDKVSLVGRYALRQGPGQSGIGGRWEAWGCSGEVARRSWVIRSRTLAGSGLDRLFAASKLT